MWVPGYTPKELCKHQKSPIYTKRALHHVFSPMFCNAYDFDPTYRALNIHQKSPIYTNRVLYTPKEPKITYSDPIFCRAYQIDPTYRALNIHQKSPINTKRALHHIFSPIYRLPPGEAWRPFTLKSNCPNILSPKYVGATGAWRPYILKSNSPYILIFWYIRE